MIVRLALAADPEGTSLPEALEDQVHEDVVRFLLAHALVVLPFDGQRRRYAKREWSASLSTRNSKLWSSGIEELVKQKRIVEGKAAPGDDVPAMLSSMAEPTDVVVLS